MPSFVRVFDENDESSVKSYTELFKDRKDAIMSELSLDKLRDSITKSVKNKNNAYSHKELIKIAINLGLVGGSKIVLIDRLTELKKEHMANN